MKKLLFKGKNINSTLYDFGIFSLFSLLATPYARARSIIMVIMARTLSPRRSPPSFETHDLGRERINAFKK